MSEALLSRGSMVAGTRPPGNVETGCFEGGLGFGVRGRKGGNADTAACHRGAGGECLHGAQFCTLLVSLTVLEVDGRCVEMARAACWDDIVTAWSQPAAAAGH